VTARILAALTAIALLGAGDAAGRRPPLAYPPTPMRPVVDVYHAQRYVDPYRWLEDGRSPEVVAWVAAQTAFANDYLARDATAPALRARVAELIAGTTTRSALVLRANRWFALRRVGDGPLALVVRDGSTGRERVLAQGGGIETFAVSPDGRRIALARRAPGEADATIDVLGSDGVPQPGDAVPLVGGGPDPVAILWDRAGAGFVHTLRSADGVGLELAHHTLGIPAFRDTYVFGRGLPRGTRYALRAPVSGSALAVFASPGAGAAATVFVSSGGGAFREVATPAEGVTLDAGAYVGEMLALVTSGRQPRGEVVAIDGTETAATGRVLVPPGPEAIVGIVAVRGGFATREVARGDGSARLFGPDGTQRAQLPVPPFARVSELAADPAGGPIVLGSETDLAPGTWLALDPATGAAVGEPVASGSSSANVGDVVAVRVEAPTRDPRVAVPLEILLRRGLRPSPSTPTILRAYGAFGDVGGPQFRPALLAWLERGGVFARAAVRGGGDEGEPWHRAARLESKTVSSNDLAASARWLGTHGYADAAHLGLAGTGAGGLADGLAMTRNPTLYRAVVAIDGVFDLLHAEEHPGGRADAAEFGSVADLVQFAYLQSESPYLDVVERGAYPATLLETGDRDGRYDSADSRKMSARLQADSSSPYPQLLIERPNAELDAGPLDADADARSTADELIFFAGQLGLREAPTE